MEQKPTQPVQVTNPSMMESDSEVEIDLLQLGYEILDKLKYIIIAACLGLLLAGIYTFVIAVPKYEAVAKIYILNSNDSVINLADLQMGKYLASDYTELFKTWEVNETVRTNLGLPYSYSKLEKMVKISNPADTRILYLTVTSSDPQEAVTMANEYAKVVSDYVSRIMAAERPNMFSEAILPEKPISPKKAQNLIIGLLLGLLLSIGIITVRFVLNDSIKSVDDVEKYIGLPVLAIVPMMNDHNTVSGSRGSK